MARISLLAVLIAGVSAPGSFAAEAPNTLDLDGREVVVRLYKDRQWKRSTEFVIWTHVIEGREIKLDFPDTEWKVAIILAVSKVVVKKGETRIEKSIPMISSLKISQ